MTTDKPEQLDSTFSDLTTRATELRIAAEDLLQRSLITEKVLITETQELKAEFRRLLIAICAMLDHLSKQQTNNQ